MAWGKGGLLPRILHCAVLGVSEHMHVTLNTPDFTHLTYSGRLETFAGRSVTELSSSVGHSTSNRRRTLRLRTMWLQWAEGGRALCQR